MSSPIIQRRARGAPVLSAFVALTLGAAPALAQVSALPVSAPTVAPSASAPTVAPSAAPTPATHPPPTDLGGHGPAIRTLLLGPTLYTAVGAIGTTIGYSYWRSQAIDTGNTIRSMGGIGACSHPTYAAFGPCFSLNLSLQARNEWANWAWGTSAALAFELSFLAITYAVAPRGAKFSEW